MYDMLSERVWQAVCNPIFRVPETMVRIYFHAYGGIRIGQIRIGRGNTVYNCKVLRFAAVWGSRDSRAGTVIRTWAGHPRKG
jgi:hypothetical protein